MKETSIQQSLSRRSVLGWGAGSALLTASVSGCSFFSVDPKQQGGGGTVGGGGDPGAKESPMLAALVDSGELPPVAERLPADPLVVEVAAPGAYGGTFRSPTIGPGDGGPFYRMIGYEPPLRMNPMVTEALPNICTAIDTSDDGTEFTLRLREGMRWSDGEPFTADDIVFAVQDVYGNTEIAPVPPNWLSQNDELAEARKVDDTTVTIAFSESNGTFAEASTRVMDLVRYPKHYARQFLPKYNDQAEQVAKDNDFDAWYEYWGDRTDMLNNPELPTLSAWVIVTPLGEGQQVELERNPYYWKTDPDGRQLPYIDKLSYQVVADPQVILLKTTDGEFDLVYREADVTPTNKPVFAKSREESGYELKDLTATYSNSMALYLNLANKDKARRALYQNRDFRIGLSHAIDREELITAVWQRQGEPWQVAPYPESTYYDEEFAKQYTEYDPGKANAYLDDAGITERDNKGFRTLPGGERLTITLDLVGGWTPEWAAAADMISDMWSEVGVRLSVNTIDRTLFYERKTAEANQHDAGVWFPTGGYTTETIDPRGYLPYSDESVWATPWALWNSSRGTSGTEPIGPAKQQIELFWKFEETPDPAEREEIFSQILDIAKEQFWVIGIGTAPDPYLVVKNRLKNVTGGIPHSWAYRTPAHANPASWYIDEEAEA